MELAVHCEVNWVAIGTVLCSLRRVWRFTREIHTMCKANIYIRGNIPCFLGDILVEENMFKDSCNV